MKKQKDKRGEIKASGQLFIHAAGTWLCRGYGAVSVCSRRTGESGIFKGDIG